MRFISQSKSVSLRHTTLCVGLLLGFVIGSGCQPAPSSSNSNAKTSAASPAGSPPDMSSQAGPANVSSGANDDASSTPDLPSAGDPAGDTTAIPSDADGGSTPAPSTPLPSGDVQEIVFEDIQLPIQADIVFRPFMLTDRVKDLDGQRIRISGYMLPDSKTKGIQEFVLLKNTECKFGPGGQADHLLNVLLVPGVATRYESEAISVEGIFQVNPFTGPDGNTWSIYDLKCDKVEIYKPKR